MKKRIFWIGGNHKRHLYYINKIAEHFDLVGGIIQEREKMRPYPPDGLAFEDLANWSKHFYEREKAEEKYFGNPKVPDIKLLKVDTQMLNSDDSAEFLKSLKPNLVLIFGTGIIREPLLSALPKDVINLHLGISPRYRGAATLFWPFYFLEPNWAGATFHYVVNTPDGGDIIHQVRPYLDREDGIHDTACKTVLQASIEVLILLELYKHGWKKFTQKPEAGKNFLESDFKPQYLRMIYSEFNNKIVRAYLDGEIKAKEPVLRRQF